MQNENRDYRRNWFYWTAPGADLIRRGHEVIVIARGQYSRSTQPIEGANFVALNINETDKLQEVFQGCDAVAHCAGTSVEDSKQTFQQLHVEGTRSVVKAAEKSGMKKFVLLSYLNVHPNVRSTYHKTKWEGEEIVRASKLNFPSSKPGWCIGPGDSHLLHRLSNLISPRCQSLLLFNSKKKTVRLVAVEDLVPILEVCLLRSRTASPARL